MIKKNDTKKIIILILTIKQVKHSSRTTTTK